MSFKPAWICFLSSLALELSLFALFSKFIKVGKSGINGAFFGLEQCKDGAGC